ncbi:MAG: cob(I)yrinic acid a,c-diamide adenosyltransferase [Elusimicrobiota bacterium]
MAAKKNRPLKNSFVHIYTGDGKGKTTASIGQAVRAASAGNKVLFVFFNKKKPKQQGEYRLMEQIGIKTKFYACKHPAFYPDEPDENIRRETLKGLKYIDEQIKNEKYDMVVLDEILISLRDNFITEKELMEFLNKNSEKIGLILTGRVKLTKKLKSKADLISQIRNIKHPFEKGAKYRKGIEI